MRINIYILYISNILILYYIEYIYMKINIMLS